MPLIPELPIGEFRKLKADEIKDLRSCVLTCGGEYLATLIIPQTDYIKTQVEYLGELSNGVKPKN